MDQETTIPDPGNDDSPEQETPIPDLGEPAGDPLGDETGVIDNDGSDE